MDEGKQQQRVAMGARIVRLREDKGWNQPELAIRAGISQPSLWSLENGKTMEVTHRTLVRIAATLGTTAEYLWTGVEAEDERAREEAELVSIFRRLDDAGARLALLQSARTLLHAKSPQTADQVLSTRQRKQTPSPMHKRRKR